MEFFNIYWWVSTAIFILLTSAAHTAVRKPVNGLSKYRVGGTMWKVTDLLDFDSGFNSWLFFLSARRLAVSNPNHIKTTDTTFLGDCSWTVILSIYRKWCVYGETTTLCSAVICDALIDRARGKSKFLRIVCTPCTNNYRDYIISNYSSGRQESMSQQV